MSLFAFLRTIGHRFEGPEAKLLRSLHSAEQMRKILDRERTRAERGGSVLTLLAFASAEFESDCATLVHIVKVLNGRLRSTDVLGWLDRQRVAVLLPGTPASGAWQMADNVLKSMPADRSVPECHVYSFPTDWIGSETPKVADAQAPPTLVDEKPVYAMESLFVNPMPLWKRSLDLGGAILGGIAIMPLLLAVALAIKLTSPGPVLFKQVRSGRGGKKFLMYKFRSMVVGAEAKKQELLALNEQDGPAFKLKSDPRVTPLGQFLRKTSLDELPQLWNVIKGDMSLVGPRPLVCAESDACQGWQRRRLDVTPGLTCIFQAQGRVGTAFTDWMRMDIRYIKQRTLVHDFKLVWKTLVAVIGRRASH